MWNTIILNPMVNILIWIYSFVFHNFGIAIIIFTILIRLITYPLTASQLKGQKKMQEMTQSKKYQEVQKKYKDDREKLAQEQMKLYKEMGINPLGSCLPLVIQFPIMIGLYQAVALTMASAPIQLLNLSRDLYSFIPGAQLIPINSQFLWMNLGLAENIHPLFWITPTIGFPLMTIIVVITTYLQSKLMTPPTTPGDQGAQMSKMMTLYMPILMGWITFSLSSGLALYFIVSNVLAIAQYALMGQIHWNNLLPKKKVAVVKK
ncbi:MAG TPA: YidC/Oxa1 family membrane protein insertase [Anaerolineales bacterium]|nr:YidC/Oxa1 family membrane protein insertase [Anaerolineales bacterium]